MTFVYFRLIINRFVLTNYGHFLQSYFNFLENPDPKIAIVISNAKNIEIEILIWLKSYSQYYRPFLKILQNSYKDKIFFYLFIDFFVSRFFDVLLYITIKFIELSFFMMQINFYNKNIIEI